METRGWNLNNRFRHALKLQGQELVVYTAHLHPAKQELREREVDAMLESMSSDLAEATTSARRTNVTFSLLRKSKTKQ